MLLRILGTMALLCVGACAADETRGGDGDTTDTSVPSDDGDSDTPDSDVDDVGDATIETPPGDDSPPPPPPPPPEGSVPTDPVAFDAGTALRLHSGSSYYWALAPRDYDATHQTPTQLFIYLHGCGGASSDDVYAATNFYASWLGMAPGDGEEGPCWDPIEVVDGYIMDAIADMKTHFNIDTKRILIGGYSAGGEMTFYTAFHHADTFAATLTYNSSPYSMDPTPQQQAETLAGWISNAAWKLNVVHLAHTEDLVYPIAAVRTQLQMLVDAGFPVVTIERPGTHADDTTTSDRNALVYPYLSAGLHSP